jgi:hypothetical protein
MFGKFVAVALPMFETDAENVMGVCVVMLPGETVVAPAVKSGSAFVSEQDAVEPPFEPAQVHVYAVEPFTCEPLVPAEQLQ